MSLVGGRYWSANMTARLVFRQRGKVHAWDGGRTACGIQPRASRGVVVHETTAVTCGPCQRQLEAAATFEAGARP